MEIKGIKLSSLIIIAGLALLGCHPQPRAGRRQGTVVLSSSPTGGGATSGSGTYDKNTVITLQAFPAQDYAFDHWSDGPTNAQRTFTVPRGTTRFTAYFIFPPPPPPVQYGTIATQVSPPNSGYVQGAGTYKVGDTAKLTAVAYTNWLFDKWQDGINLNPRSVSISAATTVLFVANFFTNPPPPPPTNQYSTVHTDVSPGGSGNVTGGGYTGVGSFLVLSATPNKGWRFAQWQDAITDNPRTVQVMTNDTWYTAFFLTNQPTPHQVALAWTYSTSTNPAIAYYNLYFGTNQASYKNFVNVGLTNQATVTNLTGGLTYYYSVTAVDRNAMESAYSNQVTNTVPSP